jgi:hypothetical protein
MVDTPSKPFPAQKPPVRPVLARIDPEGNVSATWRTWLILAGAIVWATMFYVEVRGLPAQVNALAIEVQAHREILIKANLLNPTNTVKVAQ